MFHSGTARHGRQHPRGQTLVFMALGLLVFLGFVALSIDGGMLLSTRRSAQASADSAALAAAYARVRGENWQQRAWDVASENGFDASRGDVIQVTCETAAGAPCPAAWNYDEEFIRVSIQTTRKTAFAQLFSHDELETTVEAVARVRVDKQPLFGMDAFVALAPHGQGGLSGGIKLNSNSIVIIHGGGMLSNSDDSDKSIWGLGTSRIYLDDGQALKAVGGVTVPYPDCSSGACVTGIDQMPYPPTDYLNKKVPAMPSLPACTDNVRGRDLESYNNGTLGSSGTTKVYCVDGDVDLEDITMLGHITFVMQDRDSQVTFDNDVEIEYLDIFMEDGEVEFKAGVDFHADHLHVYGSGDASINILGNTNVRSEDTLFYLMEGNVDWNGNASVKFCGPPKDDPRGFGGLTMYLAQYDGSPDLHIHGNTENWIAGTVLAPRATIVYNGNSDNYFSAVNCHGITDTQGYPTQVIGYSLKFNGNTFSEVDFNTDFIFTANAPVIELVK